MNNITFDVLNKKSITGISELSILLKKIQNAQQ